MTDDTTNHDTITMDDDRAADRLRPYLSARAERIPAASPDLSRVVARAGQRRRRRLTAGAVAATFVLGLGAVGVVHARNDGQTVIESASPVPPSTPLAAPGLTWRTVSPRSGLAAGSEVVSAGGAQYGIATAPGIVHEDERVANALYRSTDGVEWSTVTTPNDFALSSVGGDDERVYAVGTVPAGGAMGVSVVSASAGGTFGPETALPIDVEALARQVKAPVRISATSVAVGGGHVVVAATASISLYDMKTQLAGVDVDGGYALDDGGITTYAKPDAAEAEKDAAKRKDQAVTTAGTALPGVPTPTPAPQAVAPATAPPATTAPAAPAVSGRFTWTQLGLSDVGRELLFGKPFVFVAGADGVYAPVATPSGLRGTTSVVSTATGFRLVASMQGVNPAVTRIWRSNDLATWTDGGTVTGIAAQVGSVGSTAVIVTDAYQSDRPAVIHTELDDGTWSTLALDTTPGLPAGAGFWNPVAIGPLGIALIRWGNGDEPPTIVHTFDGVAATATPVPREVDGEQVVPDGVVVGADAVTVTLDVVPREPSNAAPATKLLVGVRP